MNIEVTCGVCFVRRTSILGSVFCVEQFRTSRVLQHRFESDPKRWIDPPLMIQLCKSQSSHGIDSRRGRDPFVAMVFVVMNGIIVTNVHLIDGAEKGSRRSGGQTWGASPG